MPLHRWPRLYVSGPLPDDQYEALAARAAALGATHLEVGDLPRKPRHEKSDPADPYLEYSFILGCLFRYLAPDELRAMTPLAYQEEVLATLQRRCASLRRHGLHGRLWLLDPHAWPEEVFAAHPEWRGPRVDYPPRTRRPYFAPCIDHPEVLRLYRETVRRLLTLCPEIDTFRLTINDSGSGVCWSQHLYSGTNGPAACQGRAMGERLRDFMQAWLEGARAAGVEARVLMSPRGLSPAQAEEGRQRQPPGGIVLPQPSGFPNSHAGSGGPRPTLGLANPIGFLNGLAEFQDPPEVHLHLTCELDWRLAERFVRQPVRGYAERATWLLAFAAEWVGTDRAEALVSAWRTLESAYRRMTFMPWGGLLIEHGALSKRWINRPFVVDHARLGPGETEYWEPFLFTAGGEREVENLFNIHAIQVIDGVNHARGLYANCHQGAGELRQAATALEGFAVPELTLLAARLRCLGHL